MSDALLLINQKQEIISINGDKGAPRITLNLPPNHTYSLSLNTSENVLDPQLQSELQYHIDNGNIKVYQNGIELSSSAIPGALSGGFNLNFVGSTPPENPIAGYRWFNLSNFLWYYYDPSRLVWLSDKDYPGEWGHDNANGNYLRGFGVNSPRVTTNVRAPVDLMVVSLYAQCEGGNTTKLFHLFNSITALDYHSFNLADDGTGQGFFNDGTLAIQLPQGTKFWVRADSAGPAALEASVIYSFKAFITP